MKALGKATSSCKYCHSLDSNSSSKPAGSFNFMCYSVRYFKTAGTESKHHQRVTLLMTAQLCGSSRLRQGWGKIPEDAEASQLYALFLFKAVLVYLKYGRAEWTFIPRGQIWGKATARILTVSSFVLNGQALVGNMTACCSLLLCTALWSEAALAPTKC